MRFSLTAAAIAAFTIGESAAFAPHRHAIHHAHGLTRKHAEPQTDAALERRNALIHLFDHDASKLEGMGAQLGHNLIASGSQAPVWLGEGGQYTNEFTNLSGEDVILVMWGPMGSWVNANKPYLTRSITNGSSQVVSFNDGASGAWAAVYSDTKLVNGQVSNTWGEFTMGNYGVMDVSREVNMQGHGMEIVMPQCTSNMEKCVFVCGSGDSCLTGYVLQNCDTGSQPGANFGTYAGAPSGGCGGMGQSGSFKTTFLP